jgi:hypothetical protein
MARAPIPADPTAAAAPDPTADPAASSGDQSADVLVTICKAGDGSYTVYAGDEPDDDEGAEGEAGGMMASAGAAPAGQPAGSIGEALKAALDILQADASSAGAPGSSDDQFQGGFAENAPPEPAVTGGKRVGMRGM